MDKAHKRILAILNNVCSNRVETLSNGTLRSLVKKITSNRESLIKEALDELRSGRATGEYGTLLVLIEFVEDYSFSEKTNSHYLRQLIGLVGEIQREFFERFRNRDCVAV